MINRLLHLATRHPGRILAAVALLTLLALAGLVDPRSGELRLAIDPSVNRLLPERDPDRVFYEHIRRVFGSEDLVMVALDSGSAEPGIFTADMIARVGRISEALQALPGVHRVQSLATVPNLQADADSLDVGSLAEQVAQDPSVLDGLREGVTANPLYGGNLVSRDGRAAAILVYFKDLDDREFLARNLDRRIAAIAAAEAGAARVWLTGAPVIKAETTRLLLAEMRFVLPAMLLVGALFLLLVFRNPAGVLLPLSAILLALAWTLGALAWLGRPLNMVTVIVPPLVFTVGLAYAMHMMSEFYSAREEEPDQPQFDLLVRRVLAAVGLPLLITGLTTLTGFIALGFNPLLAIREFAWLAVLGVLCTMGLTLSYIPAMLVLLRGRSGVAPAQTTRLFQRVAKALTRLNLRYRRQILIAGVALMVVALIGTLRVEVATDFIEDLPADAPVRRHYEAVRATFGGASPFYIVVDGHGADAFVHPANLREIEALQRWLARQPEIAGSLSLVDSLKLINRSLNGNDPRHFRIPEDRALIKQLLVFGGGEDLDGLVDKRFSVVNLQVRASVDDSAAIAALTQRIEERLAALPPPLTARVTGSSVVIARALDNIAGGQLFSIALAMGVIYLLMAAMFISWRAGALALLPNLLPVAVYFGALGLLGIPLTPTTSLIACITLGIAVDDTIHYMVRFNNDARRLANEAKAAFSALEGVLRPITYTTLALCLGFLVLTTSDLKNQMQFGALSAFTLLLAWLCNVTLAPALTSGVRIVTLWDVLRLDLGEDPQHSIPLMQGLTLRQARTFALLSNILDVKAGTRIMSEGEEGDHMYVVISGQLRVWVERHDGPVDLATLSRGAILGEIGFFVHKRSANVDAITDARLLRFNVDDLEQLRRRRPSIAAIIYRNLNRVQAERLARTTHMMR
jgi:predicted RND superfamily exporter protein